MEEKSGARAEQERSKSGWGWVGGRLGVGVAPPKCKILLKCAKGVIYGILESFLHANI